MKRRSERLAAVALTCVASSSAFADARTDYVLNCMGCHRADGFATPPDVPALAERVGYYLQVQGGREYLVQVPGAANAPLSDAALARVINWIVRSFAGSSAPPVFAPYSANEVAQARSARPVDVVRQRADLAGRIRARFPEARW